MWENRDRKEQHPASWLLGHLGRWWCQLTKTRNSREGCKVLVAKTVNVKFSPLQLLFSSYKIEISVRNYVQ